jgi:4-carboxymuconolactone decarboxylase
MSDTVYNRGMTVRRRVLGDEWVDRANENKTAFTEDFQALITRYAWGEIWDRDGLDRSMRSAITLMALIALDKTEELKMHIAAARRIGLSAVEIKEIILHAAIYCGVPAANQAFAAAESALSQFDSSASDDRD